MQGGWEEGWSLTNQASMHASKQTLACRQIKSNARCPWAGTHLWRAAAAAGTATLRAKAAAARALDSSSRGKKYSCSAVVAAVHVSAVCVGGEEAKHHAPEFTHLPSEPNSWRPAALAAAA